MTYNIEERKESDTDFAIHYVRLIPDLGSILSAVVDSPVLPPESFQPCVGNQDGQVLTPHSRLGELHLQVLQHEEIEAVLVPAWDSIYISKT